MDENITPIEARVDPKFRSKHLVVKLGFALLILGGAIGGYYISTQPWTFPLSSVVLDQPLVIPNSRSTSSETKCPKPNVALVDIFPQGNIGTVFCWTKLSYEPRFFNSVQDKNCRRYGSHGLRLKYDFTGQNSGGWGVFFTHTPTQHFDASTFSSLVFWVKGESGGEKFQVGLMDTNGKDKKGKEGKVDSEQMVVVSATEWKRVSVLLSSFIDKGEIVDKSSINNVNVGFKSDYGSGTICIDDIAFE